MVTNSASSKDSAESEDSISSSDTVSSLATVYLSDKAPVSAPVEMTGRITKGELPLVDKVLDISLNYVNRFIFILPFKYVDKRRVEPLTSYYHRIPHLIILSLTSLATALQVISILHQASLGQFKVQSRIGVFRILNVVIASELTIFHISLSLFSSHEMEEVWNLIMHHVRNRVPSSTLHAIDTKSVTIIFVFLGGVYLFAALGLIRYWMDCEFHVYGGFLPTCHSAVQGSFLLRMLLASIHIAFTGWTFLFGAIIGGSCVPCVQGYLASILALKDQLILADLTCIGDEEEWNINYRCLNILETTIYNCFGRLLIPIFFLTASIILVFSNCIIMASDSEFVTRCSSFFLNLSLFIVFKELVHTAAGFPHLTKSLLEFRKESCKGGRSPYTFRYLRSCREVRIFVGNFFYLTKKVSPLMFDIVLTNTITILLI